jgi:antitoxin ParD1/3/4
MTIELSPALAAIIQERLQSGAFQSVEDVLLDALQVQRERESWLQSNKKAIDEKIARGLAQLDRGEGIRGDQLRDRLEVRKSAWLSDPARS